jgi:signal transduction histidine kinase
VTIRLEEQAGRVLLMVHGTDIGIPPSLQASAFEKFSPASRAGVGGEASTGLGLFFFFTQRIVQLHRGRLWVESQESKGTCFFVELN